MASDLTDIPDLSDFDDCDEASGSGLWLSNFLYPRPAARTVGEIFKWWEKRRPAFNAIVGISGMFTYTMVILASQPLPTLSAAIFFSPLVYGVLANICFTTGSIIEMAFHKIWGSEVKSVGPGLWRSGLIFSVGLTLVLPSIIVVISLVARFVAGFF